MELSSKVDVYGPGLVLFSLLANPEHDVSFQVAPASASLSGPSVPRFQTVGTCVPISRG